MFWFLLGLNIFRTFFTYIHIKFHTKSGVCSSNNEWVMINLVFCLTQPCWWPSLRKLGLNLNPILQLGWVGVWGVPPHSSGRNSQTVIASYTKLSEFFCLPIPVNLRHFRAISHVWGGHRRLWKTGGSRRKCLKTWFLGQNTP